METARITITSCSGETAFELDITTIEKGMLYRMVKASKENSDSCCQPTIRMELIR